MRQFIKHAAVVIHPVQGVGLGLRRALLDPLAECPPEQIDFLELAPENWIGIGGKLGRQLDYFTERYPCTCHGLSLSLGGPAPLDEVFLHRLQGFLDRYRIRCYSEHLSYCGDDGHLYDLMPIPFTPEAVQHVASRIRRAQDILERRIAIENVSYYAAPGQEMEEIDFLNAVLEEADCDLLFDVNNVYVNSINHGYDAIAFLKALPARRIAYFHVAGHHQEAADLLIDTHGEPVISPVWSLLETAYAHFGVVPTLLERDFNIPPLGELQIELSTIARLQAGTYDHDQRQRTHAG